MRIKTGGRLREKNKEQGAELSGKERSFGRGGEGLMKEGGRWMWEEGEDCRILNSRLSLLQLGRPAVLMKTSE